MLPQMLLPFRLGLGAKFGAGHQYISWIELTDHIRALRFLLDRDDQSGPVNLTAPNPATNAQLTKALAATLRRPALFPVQAGALKLALGEMSTELLSSCRAVPARLQEAGFEFRYPALGPALAAAIAGHVSGLTAVTGGRNPLRLPAAWRCCPRAAPPARTAGR